jgi:hypothetical protein
MADARSVTSADEGSKAPTFWQALRESYALARKQRGLIVFIPTAFLLFLFLPQVLCYVLDYFGVLPSDQGYFYYLIAAIIAANGFIGSVVVNIFSQCISMTSDKDFSWYLRSEGVDTNMYFLPQFCIAVIFINVVLCVVVIYMNTSPLVNEIRHQVAALPVGLFLYGLYKIFMLLDLIRKIAWHRTDFFYEKVEVEIAKRQTNPE